MNRGGATAITVTWDRTLQAPRSFTWRARRYRIERVLHTWVIDTAWWDERSHISRHYTRVLAEGRVFDLYFDRLRRAWYLEKALN